MKIKIGCPTVKLKRRGAPVKRNKSGSIKALLEEMYETRRTKSQTYDKERSKYNVYGYPPGCSNVTEAIEYLEKLYEDNWKATNGDVQMRKDRVLGFTGIIKPPADYMNQSGRRGQQLLQHAFNEYKRICEEHNIVIDGWALHKDEEGDHIHVFGHSKDFNVHDFSDLPFKGALNRDLPRRVRRWGFGEVQECKPKPGEKKKPHGRDVNTYRRDKIKEETDELKVQREALQEELRLLNAQAAQLKEELLRGSERLSEQSEDIQAIENASVMLSEAYRGLQDVQKAYQAGLASVEDKQAFEAQQRQLMRQAEEAQQRAAKAYRETGLEDILERWERNKGMDNGDRNMSL